jgi:hypothetical protein
MHAANEGRHSNHGHGKSLQIMTLFVYFPVDYPSQVPKYHGESKNVMGKADFASDGTKRGFKGPKGSLPVLLTVLWSCYLVKSLVVMMMLVRQPLWSCCAERMPEF